MTNTTAQCSNAAGALDTPACRVDRVPSAVTGCVLEYVSPAPLGELLCGLDQFPISTARGGSDGAVAAVLLPFAGFRSTRQIIDSDQVIRTGDITIAHKRHASPPELIELARAIDARNKGLRQEIVFAGARNASSANHVFAPADELPGRFDELVAALARPPSGVSAYLTGIVVGYYACRLHPFVGGNGRWSRLVAAQAATGAGNATEGVMAAVFLAIMNQHLASRVWPRADHAGLREYIGLALAFQTALRGCLVTSSVLDETAAVQDVLRSFSPSRLEFERGLIQSIATDSFDVEKLKVRFSLSRRRADGMSCALREVMANRMHESTSPTSISAVWQLVSTAKNQALELAQ